MANPSLQIGNSNWAIKEDDLLGYSTVGTNYLPKPMTMTRASAGTRVDENGLVNYAEVIGGEEIEDGDFLLTGTQAQNITGTYWTTGTGTEISSGIANVTETGNALSQSDAIFVSGNSFIIEFTISNYVSGSITVGNVTPTTYRSGNKTYTLTGTGAGGNFWFYSNAFIGSISNVSVKQYTANNLARVDYDGSVSSLLAEPQRTNLITYSEDFSNAIWQKQTGIVPTYNTTETLSPDGTNNATKFIGTGSTGVFKASIIVSGNISRSVYLKSVTGTTTATFKEPNTGTPSAISLTITNEWQRFEMIGDNGSSSQGLWIDDITSDGLYMWGAQVEQGSYATSYIPTDGGTVTRVQDQYSKTGISNLINSEEGVLFVEMAALADDLMGRSISLNDGTYTNTVILRYLDLSNQIQGVVRIGGSFKGICTHTLSDSTISIKVAYKWKDSDFALWINGSEVATSSDVGAFSTDTINKLSFDKGDDTQDFYGKVKQLQVYKTTDIDLAALTS